MSTLILKNLIKDKRKPTLAGRSSDRYEQLNDSRVTLKSQYFSKKKKRYILINSNNH